MHEYNLRVEGHERKHRHDWELTRWQTWQLLAPNYKKGRAPRTPKAFYRFPWEQTTEEDAVDACRRSQVTAEEAAVLDKLFASKYGNKDTTS